MTFPTYLNPLNKIMVFKSQKVISIIEFVSFAASRGLCSERRKVIEGGLDPWVAPHKYLSVHKIKGKMVKNKESIQPKLP